MGELDRVAIMIEEIGALNKLELLQDHGNEQIYQKSLAMLDAFFSEKVCTCIFMIYIFYYFYYRYIYVICIYKYQVTYILF